MTVRWSGQIVAIFLALWASAGPASAGVRPLAAAPGGGPALLDGTVFWSAGTEVFSAPVSGDGPVRAVGGVAARTELVAGAGVVAARGGDAVSVAAGGGGAFARVSPDAGAPPLFGIVPSVQPSSAGLVVLENDGAWLRRDG